MTVNLMIVIMGAGAQL